MSKEFIMKYIDSGPNKDEFPLGKFSLQTHTSSTYATCMSRKSSDSFESASSPLKRGSNKTNSIGGDLVTISTLLSWELPIVAESKDIKK